ARVDEIVHDQDLLSGFCGLDDRRRDGLEDLDTALALMVVTLDRNALDGADVELPRHDGGRHEATAGDCDAGLEGTGLAQAPGERPAVAMELVPAHGKGFLAR